eukprot:g17424.t1
MEPLMILMTAREAHPSPELFDLIGRTVREGIALRPEQQLSKKQLSELLCSYAVLSLFDLDYFSWARNPYRQDIRKIDPCISPRT